MSDKIKNLRITRVDNNLFIEKTLVDSDFFLKSINIRASTSDRAIFFEFFFSKLDNDWANQKKSKKINIVMNQISRIRFSWLSFIEAKTTTAWKEVKLLREELISKSKNFDCLYCAKQKLECTCVLKIACTTCNKKKWMRFNFLFVSSNLLSIKTDQESSRLWRTENEDLKLWVCSFQVDSWRVKTKARTLNRCQENFKSRAWDARNS